MYRFRDHTRGVTWRSKRSFDRHIHKLGPVHRVRGYIYNSKYGPDAAVMIYGEFGTMRLSGLSWGYGGEGPNGLRYVLQKLNVNEANIRKVLSNQWEHTIGTKWDVWRYVPEAA